MSEPASAARAASGSVGARTRSLAASVPMPHLRPTPAQMFSRPEASYQEQPGSLVPLG